MTGGVGTVSRNEGKGHIGKQEGETDMHASPLCSRSFISVVPPLFRPIIRDHSLPVGGPSQKYSSTKSCFLYVTQVFDICVIVLQGKGIPNLYAKIQKNMVITKDSQVLL